MNKNTLTLLIEAAGKVVWADDNEVLDQNYIEALRLVVTQAKAECGNSYPNRED